MLSFCLIVVLLLLKILNQFFKIYQENQEKENEKNNDNDQGDSCGWGDRSDFLDDIDPQASSQDDNGDRSEGGNKNTFP